MISLFCIIFTHSIIFRKSPITTIKIASTKSPIPSELNSKVFPSTVGSGDIEGESVGVGVGGSTTAVGDGVSVGNGVGGGVGDFDGVKVNEGVNISVGVKVHVSEYVFD